ncbi:EGT [Urbanus proteus nucleopolyhedrovirus]|uniref:Ecdysteroid UDP-glucosyltransferase n=1 Tax=Urbanus proteus nucleopolyhedrovirus TaxID=1675866 RepID=A0A161C6Z7_9ABAC|nr:EGT [Urbanus proteus nucleopolyhedrovirus]AKR17395.1 EGT [Urbanus proteus nucleopolyhedrovirus]
MNITIVLFAIIFVCQNSVYSSNILAVFPTPAYSHHKIYKIYIQELARRGHNVYVINSSSGVNYTQKQQSYYGAITQFDVSMSEVDFKTLMSNATNKKIVGGVPTFDDYADLVKMYERQMNMPHVQRFINDRHLYKIDLIILEAFLDYTLVYSHLFNDAPVVQISPGFALAEHYETMGAVARHPVYYPNLWRENYRNLNSAQTVQEFIVEWKLKYDFERLTELQNEIIKQQFDEDAPSLQQLRDRVKLLLVNVHPIFDNNRPVPPSVQYLGSLHLHDQHKKKKPMDKYIDKFLNESFNGAVYVSFGTSISTRNINSNILNVLIETFRALSSYNVLWKHDLDEEYDYSLLPHNVLTQNWFDQHQVLKHKNVKVFVTQCGALSTAEAIDATVPLVGLPMMGDQMFMANKYEELGIGVRLNVNTLNSKNLVQAIKKVMLNTKYLENVKRLNKITNVQHNKPLQKAIQYTEHVLNTGGDDLKTTASNKDYNQYYMTHLYIPFISFLLIKYFMRH